uniref:Uncharacterized protein n=1 Tax=Oryza barthii TaxID=65489 RepID=A0A0D3FUX2_9ORYZ
MECAHKLEQRSSSLIGSDLIKIHANQVTLSLDLILQFATANRAQFNTPRLHPRCLLRLPIIAPAAWQDSEPHTHPLPYLLLLLLQASVGFVNARLFSSGFPHLKKLHLKNRHSKDLALVVDALLPAAATTITELVVERYAPSGHPTESRHRIGKDLIKIRETQVTLSLFLKL